MNSANSLAMFLVVYSHFLTNTFAHSQYRVMGGSNCIIEHSPHLVSINDTRGYRCAGSLISKDTVLTAAHCVFNINKNDIRVAAGVSDLRSFEREVRYVRAVHCPPEYKFGEYDMDIAVIKLIGEFPRTRKITEIPLCAPTLSLRSGQAMRVSGWGLTIGSMQPSSILKSAVFNVIQKEACADRFATAEIVLTESMICAESQKANTCDGDTGGSGVVFGQLCAVVSATITPFQPDYPGVYTNINNATVRNFINKWLRN